MKLNRTTRCLSTALALAAALGTALPAEAQLIDVNPALPNVMLLIDTSGSMEKMIDGTDPEVSPDSACDPGKTTKPNRWGILLQALTGDIASGYSCMAIPRKAGTQFEIDYSVNGIPPYDLGYPLPFHQPMVGIAGQGIGNKCVLVPADHGSSAPANSWPDPGVVMRRVQPGAAECKGMQLQNGFLDAARDTVRFGLMTFDTDTRAGTGVTFSSDPKVANTPTTPFDGLWSYYPGWNKGPAGAVSGRPYNCSTPAIFEVGARNSGAPPWEGPLIGIVDDPFASTADVRSVNDKIQLAIGAMRPYGSTPIAGLMSDVMYYYWGDPDGPSQDPLVQKKCRDQYVILLTDGAPNTDLRPYCTPEGASSPGGKCPYARPEETAADLLNGVSATAGMSGSKVYTFVIGFAVSSVKDGTTTVKCADLIKNGSLSAVCADPAKQTTYGACCTLSKMALAGGTDRPYFADTAGDLNAALTEIISKISKDSTTRTVPAYSPQVAALANDPNSSVTAASVYLASFSPSPGQPWSGRIQRSRYVCDSSAQLQTPAVEESKGDDFAANLNSGTGSEFASRAFAVVEPDKGTGQAPTDATSTIRPFIASAQDGVGTYGGTYTAPTSAKSAANAISPEAMSITNSTCTSQDGRSSLNANKCAQLVLDFTFGESSSVSLPSGFDPFASRAGNAFGDIYHSTPAIVGAPTALVRDETYQTFATKNATRRQVLYVATNDGLLHAFDTAVSTKENNEMWAFLPPGVLPKLHSLYPAGHALLLDGAPVVRDVVWERTKTTLGSADVWHTMLVASFGAGNRGYYAMDVTDPERPGSSKSNGPGPQFRWQLSSMPEEKKGPTRELFGPIGATPEITTIYADLGDGKGAREIGVAILPGGGGQSPTTGSCDRAAKATDAAPPSSDGYKARSRVRCWGAKGDPVAGRSVSIVRLETGEILRTFGRTDDVPSALSSQGRLIETPLDSPMTGRPIVYPNTVGAVAQRFFIGDADGTIWRFDLKSTNPSDWKAELFLDTANATVDPDTSNSWNKGEPIMNDPVVALDRVGNLVLGIATGDQDNYTATGTNYVYSVSEKLSASEGKLRAHVNWYLKFASGERASGPMAIFDGVLYFASFAPAATAATCTGGLARLWGRDFVVPKDLNDPSQGGVPRLNPSGSAVAPDFFDPLTNGKLIPGVSVNISPSCANASVGTSDPYVSGATHFSATNVTSTQPSLLAQVAGQNSTGTGAQRLEVKLPMPRSPTIVDSWAAVVE